MNLKFYQTIIGSFSFLAIIAATLEKLDIKVHDSGKAHFAENKYDFIVDTSKIQRKNGFQLICSCGLCSSVSFSFQNHLSNLTSQVILKKS